MKKAFIIKGLEEQRKGRTSVFLIPAQTGTKLFHDIILPNAKEVRFRRGRIQFEKLDENGNRIKQKSGNPLDSMIVVFEGKVSIQPTQRNPVERSVANQAK